MKSIVIFALTVKYLAFYLAFCLYIFVWIYTFRLARHFAPSDEQYSYLFYFLFHYLLLTLTLFGFMQVISLRSSNTEFIVKQPKCALNYRKWRVFSCVGVCVGADFSWTLILIAAENDRGTKQVVRNVWSVPWCLNAWTKVGGLQNDLFKLIHFLICGQIEIRVWFDV